MLQTRHPLAADALVLAPGLALARARAHEVTGPARIVFALLAAARLDGPVLWLQPGWAAERLAGEGLLGFLDPGRLILGHPGSLAALLWAAEEALRTGLVRLVVVELPQVPALTPVRRLHLAAETGGRAAPLALLLAPGEGGAPGVESRWRLDPIPGWKREDAARWRLTRLRARMAPSATWETSLAEGHLRFEPAGPG